MNKFPRSAYIHIPFCHRRCFYCDFAVIPLGNKIESLEGHGSKTIKEYLTYFNVLISQSGQQAGGPFETIPSSLLGNIVNTTNNENFPLGYFHISETDTYNLSLIELD